MVIEISIPKASRILKFFLPQKQNSTLNSVRQMGLYCFLTFRILLG